MSKKLEKSDNYVFAFNKLIDVCENAGTTVTALLDKFTTSRSAMTAWKKGNINTDVLAKIAKELNISLDDLLLEEGSQAKELTDDEQKLIAYYHNLSPTQQVEFMQSIQEMSTDKIIEAQETNDEHTNFPRIVAIQKSGMEACRSNRNTLIWHNGNMVSISKPRNQSNRSKLLKSKSTVAKFKKRTVSKVLK